jgi:hypothetical protein
MGPFFASRTCAFSAGSDVSIVDWRSVQLEITYSYTGIG